MVKVRLCETVIPTVSQNSLILTEKSYRQARSVVIFSSTHKYI